jgi:hypothetical protein
VDPRKTGGLLALVAMLAVAGCIISQDDLAGRACSTAEDCPEAYVCVGLEGQRSCEVAYPPVLAVPDGGIPDGGGVVPTYCADVKPILTGHCISTCHGPVSTGSNHPEFRLDYYEPDAGGPKGAKEMAPLIKVRAFDLRTMPPVGNPPPSDAERAVLGRWAAGGAPFCDGGTP